VSRAESLQTLKNVSAHGIDNVCPVLPPWRELHDANSRRVALLEVGRISRIELAFLGVIALIAKIFAVITIRDLHFASHLAIFVPVIEPMPLFT
jgi:hypothetical protein